MEAGTLTLAGSTCTAHRWAIAPEDGGPVDHRHHLGGVAAVGAFLLVDAITEVSLASWTRHRELRRRAEEQMALVAEELGA